MQRFPESQPQKNLEKVFRIGEIRRAFALKNGFPRAGRRDVFARFNDRAPLRVPRKMHHPRVAHPPAPGEPETFFRRAFHSQRYHIVRLFHRVYTHAPCITPDEWDTGCRGRLHFNQFRLQRRHIRKLKSRRATGKSFRWILLRYLGRYFPTVHREVFLSRLLIKSAYRYWPPPSHTSLSLLDG